MSEFTFWASKSDEFFEKTCHAEKRWNNRDKEYNNKYAYGSSFYPFEFTLETLNDQLFSGGAMAMGHFQGNSRRESTYREASVFGVDVDNVEVIAELDEHGNPILDENGIPKKKEIRRVNGYISFEEAANHPFVRKRALCIYQTASSTPEWNRFRIIFVVPEPIPQIQQWKVIQIGLLQLFAPWHPDPSCKDPTRIWFGSTKPGIRFNNLLPLDMAGGLTVDQATEDMLDEFVQREAPPAQKVDPNSDWARGKMEKRLRDTHAKVARAAPSERHNENQKGAYHLGGYFNGDWPITHEEIIATLIDANRRNGAYQKYGETEIRRCIEDGIRSAPPHPLEVRSYRKRSRGNTSSKRDHKPPVAERVKPVELAPFHADLTVNMRYISTINPELYPHVKAINVKSAEGTGKTTLSKVEIERWERALGREIRVLYVTFRASLVEESAQELGLMSYSEKWASMGISITSVPKIAITVDSLHKLADTPPFDIVILDEITKLHRHVEADTMRDGENRRAYVTVKKIVSETRLIMGFDAQNTDVATEWLKHLTGNSVLAIKNDYIPHTEETFTLFSNKELAYDEFIRRINDERGCVWIPTSTKIESEVIFAYLQTIFPEKRGILVNADNSCSKEIQHFITHRNIEVPKLDYVVASPSLSTGIDVTCPVYAVVGVFPNQPLDADNISQSMHRCRNAEYRAAWVQPSSGQFETDWLEIYHQRERNVRRTALEADFDAHNVPFDDAVLKGLNHLSSKYQAIRNYQMNDLLSYVVALLKANGYTLNFVDGENKATRMTLKIIRADLRERQKQLELANPTVNHEVFRKHRIAGTMTPEIRAGHERFIKEDTVGLEISPELWERLRTAQLRAEIRRFADLLDTEANLKEFDRQEAIKGVPYSKLAHKIMTRQFIEAFILAVFGCTLKCLPDVLKDINRDAIASLIEQFTQDNHQKLVDLLKWRPTAHSSNSLPLARYILKSIGLKLTYRRIREGERLIYLYSLDMDTWTETERLARARLAHLAKQRPTNSVPNSDKESSSSYQDSEQKHTHAEPKRAAYTQYAAASP